MLIYFSGTPLPWQELCCKKRKFNFEQLKEMKEKLPSILNFDKCLWLQPFIKAVYDLEFEEEPFYGHLKHLLTAAIL